MKDISIFLLIVYAQIFMVVTQVPEPRVYGGQFAAVGQFPYQISLQEDGSHVCGGAILTKSYVLTAAHCVTNEVYAVESPLDFIVMAGCTNISEGGFPFVPRKFIVHEKFDTISNDIAVIQLKKYFKWNEYIQPIPMNGKELHENDVVTIAGWGYTDKGEIESNELKFHYFSVSSTEYCKKVNTGRYNEGYMCLRHAIHNGACSGDSGGAAVFEGKLVGVANFVIGSCGSLKPDVYANVSHFSDWINDKIY